MNYTINDVLQMFVNPAICLIGFFLSILIFFVFSCSHFKEISYKYLKIQAIFFACNSLIIIIQPIYYSQQNEQGVPVVIAYYFIIFRIYFSSICEIIALYSNWLSGLSCLLILSNRLSSQL